MTPEDPLERLFALEQFGVKLGLDNVRRLVAALGNPHDRFAAIHVAGTNGKGSVTAMVERALRHAGYRTGRYTSPHLARIEERVAIGGEPIAAAFFRELTVDVLATADRLRAAAALQTTPTFFEVTTAIAFEAFRRASVEVAVIEVGLGGRFDATNIITPVITAITSIALDHQKHLGDTVASIAFEKAGILKRGVPAVIGSVPPAARNVIAEVASSQGAPVVDADRALVENASILGGRATITVTTPSERYLDVPLALNGRHQIDNAVVAIRILETLGDSSLRLTARDIVAGLTEVQWPARLEWLRLDERRELLLDAAHNVAGAHSLAEYLFDSGCTPLPLVLAVMKDKDVAGIVSALAPVASRFIVTSVATPRALSAEALAAQVKQVAPSLSVAAVRETDDAVAAAFVESTRVAAAGSIFFVGPLRERLVAGGALSLQG